MKTKLFYGILLLFSICFVACDDGEDGIDGIDGMDGEQGPQGPQGEPGTANVIYSEWATLQYPVRDTLIDGSHLKVSHIIAPALTSDIISNGLIMVYMKFSNTTYALPYISDAGGKPNELNFRSVVGKIFITRFAFDDSGSINISGSLQFRYVLVPGGTLASKTELNYADYNAVSEFYGFKD